MLYPKSKSEKLDIELFKNPTSEYRAAPFWAWNCDMTPELLTKEIDYIKETGFGGFHMHPRVGLATPYLSDDFMSLVKTCVEKAKKEGMRAYLYDEDKWPSGFAGGLNTKDNVEFRQKSLKITSIPYNDGMLSVDEDISKSTDELPTSKYYFLACFDVELDEEGYLRFYKRIDISEKAEHLKLFSYVEYMPTSDWCNGGAFADTMSKAAIENFVKITHERYKEVVGKDFGGVVPDNIDDLIKLPGVGRKTANLIVGDVYGKESIVVDTHMIRISNRIGLVNVKEPVKIEMELKKVIPKEEGSAFCHRIVLFGRDICSARKPKCDVCPMLKNCKRVGVK